MTFFSFRKSFLFSLFLLLISFSYTPFSFAQTTALYVASNGIDTANGGTIEKPFKTIQYALELAQPGITIQVLAGTYKEHLVTKINGTESSPITLKAQGHVILKNIDNTRILDLFNNYYIVDGFEFDGGYTDTKIIDKTADKLLWVESGSFNTIRNNFFHHAQGECVRILFFAESNVFEYNTVENCGLRDFVGFRSESSKNGEGVYVGVAPEQIDPTKCKSQRCKDLLIQKGLQKNGREIYTKNNTFSHNLIDTHGNECIDIKEGSNGNIVTDNLCLSQYDFESAAFDTRGPDNTFVHNSIGYNNDYASYLTLGDHISSTRASGHKILGAAVRAGGDRKGDAVGNNIVKNRILDFVGSSKVAIKVPSGDIQGVVCQNTVAFPLSGGFANSAKVTNASSCPSEFISTESAGVRGCVGHLCQSAQAFQTATTIPTETPTPTKKPTSTPKPTATPILTPPSAPQNLSASSPSDSKVILKWDAVTGATKYKVYWTYSGYNGVFREKKSTTTPSSTITDAKSKYTYSFYVTAVNKSRKESQSSSTVTVFVK